jgi:hypothetical protein
MICSFSIAVSSAPALGHLRTTPRSLVPECTWHMRIIEVLLARTAVEALSDDPPVLGSVTAFTGVQGSAATADAVVEAFMGLAEDSALEGYFLKNLVRHICGFEEESLVVLARVVLSDYRWLLVVAGRQSYRSRTASTVLL